MTFAHLPPGVTGQSTGDRHTETPGGTALPGVAADTLDQYRKIVFPESLSPDVERQYCSVPNRPSLVLRIHRPVGAEGSLPGLYSMHGGGYVMGSPVMDDPFFDAVCSLGMVGISVQYRLAPENPYPAALDDCYYGLAWACEHADKLGVDPRCIGVRGLSAGGGLAASLAIRARDGGGPKIAFQLLESPMLDDRQSTFSSKVPNLPVWSLESNEFGWRSYLGELYGTDDVPALAAPARALDLSNLPPAFVSVGSLDGFLDEDVRFALDLNHQGVPCELHVYPGVPHAFQLDTGSRVAQQSRQDIRAWLIEQTAEPRSQQGTSEDG